MLSVLRTVVSVAGAFLNRVRGGLFDIPFNKLFYPLFFDGFSESHIKPSFSEDNTIISNNIADFKE